MYIYFTTSPLYNLTSGTLHCAPQVVNEVIDEWLAVQRNWLYLQPIFDSEDINKQLPAEGKRFASVDKHWRATMGAAGVGAL